MEQHIARRASHTGRLAPAVLYGLNVTLWFLTGVIVEAWDLLYLILLPLLPLAVYLRRTR